MTSMRVLLIHNRYLHRGGEDAVVEAERSLLAQSGHEVALYERSNSELESIGALRAARDTLWSSKTIEDVGELIDVFRPSVIHAHNTFPLVSPSLYWVAAKKRVAVVQTLHNFRLLCPQAMFLRDGQVCEDCLGKLPWRGIVHRCYRGSAAQSAVLTAMLMTHRRRRTYQEKIARFIAMNAFCKRKFVAGGLPEDRIAIKPNFVTDPGYSDERRAGALFVGRLSPEKGLHVLNTALRQATDVTVEVIGAGPEAHVLADHGGRVSRLGFCEQPVVFEHMKRAAYLVVPSICFENFPLTVAEAFACGLPVIASDTGSLAELIEDERTGLLFRAGEGSDLAVKMDWANRNPGRMREMGRAARAVYETKYTPEKNYEQLSCIYREALAEMGQKH